MAITIKNESDKLEVTITNGHIAALSKVVKDYNLLGEKEALEFMISVMSEAGGNPINNGNGSFLPSEKLQKPNPSNA